MSDSNPGASHDADAGQVPAWRERKNLLVAGAVGAAVVVGLGGFFLLSAGGSSEDTGGLVANARTGAVVVAVPSASAAATLPAVYKLDPYRDPFAPIYPAAPTAAPSSEAATSGDDGAAGVPVAVPVDPAAPVVVATTAAPTPTPTSSKTVSETVTVKLVTIVDDNTATVSLNGGKSFAVDVGEVFGDVFSLVATFPDEGDATFNYGDDAPFGLTIGQTKKYVVTS